jgi:hypothetical protein
MEFNIEADQAGARLREGVRAHTLLVGDHDATAMINGGRTDLQRLALSIVAAIGLKIRIDGHIDGNTVHGAMSTELKESRAECQRHANELRRVEEALPYGAGPNVPLSAQARELVARFMQSQSDYRVASGAHTQAIAQRDNYRRENERLRAQMRLAGLEPDA